MAEQIQRPAPRKEEEVEEVKPKDLKAKGEELKEKLDEVSSSIDDLIDEVEKAMEETLGENQSVEDFISAYQQRGGE